jgi:hypothetical protein
MRMLGVLAAALIERLIAMRSVPIWGWADKGRVVTVQFADQSVTAKAGKKESN